jgi:RHS repeat-associated protein
LAAEIHDDGRVRIYIYADAFAMTPILFVEYESIDANPASGKRYFIYSDHLGSPVLVEDDDGKAVWQAQLDPYGVAHIKGKASIDMLLRFPGHYFDAETGLHYNRFRYYSPELGRYLQSDPLDVEGSVNLYAYTGNPLKQVDVRGDNPDDASKRTKKTTESGAPAVRQPWEIGRRPQKYERYKRQHEKNNPGVPPKTPEQWYRDYGYKGYLSRRPKEPVLTQDEWWQKFGRKDPNNPYGGEGKPDHQAVSAELKRAAEAKYPPPKYEVKSNEFIPGVPRKPDAAVIDTETGKVVVVYEAARFDEQGRFKRPDEPEKITDYEAAGIPYEFHPVGPNQPAEGAIKPPEPKAPSS